jgi:uncharacterized protein (DUF849 family)
MVKKTILTCAVTGNIHTREQNPNLPVTPSEIAQAVIDSERAGASVAHIHVRNPDTGIGTMELSCYQEVIDRIRDAGSNIVLNLTTGEGGRFIPSIEDPLKPAPGTTLCRPELRVAHIKALRPELCTLDFNTMNNGPNVVINTPRNLEIMANVIMDSNVIPEIEIFDSGDLNLALDFIDRGIISGPHIFQLVLGTRFGASADPETLVYLANRLPKGSVWAAFGIGRLAFPTLAVSYAAGGHVRTGMEDTLYVSKGELVRSNAQLVEKAVDIVQKLGGELATPDEARAIISSSGRYP